MKSIIDIVFTTSKEERVFRVQFVRRVGYLLLASAVIGGRSVSAQTQPAQPASPPPSSPLAIHVGDADLLIGGFMDLTSITRSTNTGNGIGTSFGSIPFK
ncbi:MAG TPA: hypothetical protein VH138_08645, partial [Vicinamibacterales bacterium]|nr:hypothetical protein [Vicinamibacterales bacterium]